MGFSTNRFTTGKSFAEKRVFNENKVKIEDLVDVIKLPNQKWVTLRLIGNFSSYAEYWLPLRTKKQDKIVNIPKQSLNWDENEEVFDSTIECPYQEAAAKIRDANLFPSNGNERHRNAPSVTISYYVNCIVRKREGEKLGRYNESEKATGYKDINNEDSFTPVQVLRMPSGLASRIAKLAQLNIVREDGEDIPMPISDLKYGCDIAIQYDETASGSDKYQIQLRERTPFDEEGEEGKYLIYKLTELLVPESLEDARKEAERILASHFGTRNAVSEEGFRRTRSSEFNEDGDDTPASRPASRRSDINEFSDDPKPNRTRSFGDDDVPASQRQRPSPDEDDGTQRQLRPAASKDDEPLHETRSPKQDEPKTGGRTISMEDNPESGVSTDSPKIENRKSERKVQFDL